MFEPYFNPQNSPIGPKKVKDYPNIKSSPNVKIEGILENEKCSTTWVDPKAVIEPYPNHQNSPIGPQKVKMTPKLSQN